MAIAHLAGVPFEEWISPLLVSGGGILLVVRAEATRRLRRRRECSSTRTRPDDG